MFSGRKYALQKKQKSTYEKWVAIFAKFFFACAKNFCSVAFFLPFFHVLNLGFSASDMGVIFAGPGLRVYNTFIVLNRVRAKMGKAHQTIENFAEILFRRKLTL